MILAPGNVIIIGTDPSNHAGNYLDATKTALGARTLVGDGIAYAANKTGSTGAYLCMSQYFYKTVRL